ncbi:MAG: CPBP family intramembrane metalloprotease [Nitriliruptorales bacterium]|nr:CPBP family intramembrane metalloprotease [Nitriliruptorales bacterium]
MSDPLPQPSTEATPADRPPISDVPWNIGDALLVIGIWLLTGFFVGGAMLIGLQQLFPEMEAQALSLPITLLIMIAVSVGYVQQRYPGAAGRLLGPAARSWQALGWGVLAGIFALLVFAVGLGTVLELLARLTRGTLPEVQETFRDIAADRSAAPVLVFGSVLVAPLAEELCFRGLLFSALRKRFPLWPAMGLSGLAFGLTHVQTTLDGYLLVLLIVMPLGMFLAFTYERSRTLLVPITAHAVFNLVQVALLIRQG